MEIAKEDQDVVLRMTPEGAELLSFALRAGFETTSRAEYWIRHGVTQRSVRALTTDIHAVATAERTSAQIPLEPGVEAMENPRRPRS